MLKRNGENRNKFTVIRGGLQPEIIFRSLKVVAAGEASRPFDVDAMVFEEDTWLVMSADPKVCEPELHPIRLMTGLIEARPEKPGRLLVRPGNPLRFLAVVHDFNLDPTWKEKWVTIVLREIFRKSEEHRLRAIGIPLLCTHHGRMKIERFLMILGDALKEASFSHLKSMWLISPAGKAGWIMDRLDNILGDWSI